MLFSLVTIRVAKKLSIFTLFAICSLNQALATAFQVTVDTSSINGSAGLIDFQFNPGTGAATAELLSFSSVGGLLGGPLAPIGDVTGTLPGTVTIENSTGLNDYTEQFTFGSSFNFILDLQGDLAGSGFFLALYSPNFAAPLLTNGEFIGIVNIDGQGVILDPITFPTATGGQAVATFTEVASPGVPEPSTFPLSAGAIAILCLIFKARSSFHPNRS